MTKTEIINEINRLERMNKAIENNPRKTRNEFFYTQINNSEIKKLKKLLDK